MNAGPDATCKPAPAPATSAERLTGFSGPDMHDLCDAAEAAILDGGGFGWLAPPPRHVMEGYWKGVLLVPERLLFVARLDGTIAGSGQLWLPTRNNEAGARNGQLTTLFLAPWARGHGLAPLLLGTIEEAAVEAGMWVLNLDVRETQARAIQLYDQFGYRRWGTNPNYARVNGQWVAGHYYSKTLRGDGGD